MTYRHVIQNLTSACLLIFCLCIASDADGQSKRTLEKQRKNLLKRIDNTSSVLEAKDEEHSSTLKNYELLEQLIVDRKELRENISAELLLTDSIIGDIDVNAANLNKDIASLKNEYIKLLQKKYIHKLTEQKWIYIISSSSLSEAYKRWIFSGQYENFIKSRKLVLMDYRKELDSMYFFQNKERSQKELLLESENEQAILMDKELVEKDSLLAELEMEQVNLKIDLIAQRGEREKLNQAIESTIYEEINNPSSYNAPVASAYTPPPATHTNVSVSYSGNFRKNKGKLEWPIDNGFISSSYGKQNHPTLKDIEIVNNGIDIMGGVGAQVFALFEGTVVSARSISGQGNMVIVKHGDYYSVYSKLENIYVSKGQQLESRALIGEVNNTLHLEVWKGKKKQNPQSWLRK